MAYNIQNLTSCTPQPGRIYLFDANVWRYVLLAPPSITPYEQAYVDFFQRAFQLAIDQTSDNRPKIFVNPILLSEVYHACMKIHLDAYNEGVMEDISMKQYREKHHYKTRKAALLSDIEIYRGALIASTTQAVDCLETLISIPEFCDYADHFYAKNAAANNMILVTMDGDFKFEDIEIISGNGNLLKLMRP